MALSTSQPVPSVQVNQTGVVGPAPQLVVNLTSQVGVVVLAPRVSVVSLASPVTVVNLAPVSVMNLAIQFAKTEKTGNSWTN